MSSPVGCTLPIRDENKFYITRMRLSTVRVTSLYLTYKG